MITINLTVGQAKALILHKTDIEYMLNLVAEYIREV